MSHYDALGVTPAASPAELRRAYVALARRHHPDAGGDADAMRRVNAAWEVLGDPARRAAYDRTLGAGPSPWGSSAPRDGDDDERSDLDDLLADLADDRPVTGAGQAPAWLVLVPAAMFVASLLALGAAVLLGEAAVLGFAFTLFALSVVAFFAAPFVVALAGSRRRGG